MAQIVTITNPLTGQPAQVDQLDHTAQQIDDAIARALPGGDIDIALQNKLGGIESADYPGCYYRTVDGVVEWLNPPMLLGVEYRTTERYLGKPVYVKMVDFGALPNNTIKDVSAGISSDVLLYGFIDLAKSYFGPASVARTNFNPMHENIDQIWFRLGDIRIKTNIDMSGYVAYICVKYTKNTD